MVCCHHLGEFNMRVGTFNTQLKPIWENNINPGNNFEWTTPDFGANDPTSIDEDPLAFNISNADKTNLSVTFLEDYNYLVPLFYKSNRNSLHGNMLLYSPDNVSSQDMFDNREIRSLGLCALFLDGDLNTLRVISDGDTINIKDLYSSMTPAPLMFQFLELWYNEELGFQPIMNPVATLQPISYHWHLGQYQLISKNENNEYRLRCIKPNNQLYFRRS